MKHYRLLGMMSLLSAVSWAQCVVGTPGTNCSGPLNVQPPAGNTGQSAITLVDIGLPVPTPVVGQYTLSIASGILIESDNGNGYHSLVGPPGLTGATGAPGAQGAQGSQGLTGATGATGTAGATGPAGAQGVQGLAGAVGATGPAGAQGTPGLTGAQGAQGSAGPEGPQGPAGSLAAPPDYSFFYGVGGFRAVVGTSEVAGISDRNQIDMLSAVSVRLITTIAANVLASGSYAEAEYTPDGTNWYALSGEVPVTTANGTFSTGWQGMPTGANGDYLVRIIVLNAGKTTAQVALRQLHLQFK
jgi:hypothetical protein